ncbi:DNA repair endonuclease UVH1 [Hordeum vulgare]|uniref:ERCC4 domain-containing protein n=1 Tax=Hordeum vulgare subsp. vulgare TaxID=112509 RepID=A0A8I7BDH3_HORVV|nr:DNA repair endonuclease UVH1 [Hordeum vulgare subsp. vulgare]KAE8818498.1 DNA repair endonuclease UVH1 [Hordeum vulgare]
MLPFEEQAVADLLEDPNGGLVVVSAGLPLASLAAALLLHLHHQSTSSSPSPSSSGGSGGGGCFLILSAPDALKDQIRRRLVESQLLQVHDVASDVPAANRRALYSSGEGAALFLTARVLAADLLTSHLLPSRVRALLLLAAHRSSDVSADAFIARLLRQHRLLPVYAFSDRPHAMVAGFAKAERTMKSLYIRRLHLWPRFHVLAAADLERSPPEVIDVRVPMTNPMAGIQAAILDAMDACLKELRRTYKVDVEDLTIDKGLFKSFDEIVRRQLDPIWHTLGKKTKQLVADLRTLRKLLDYLGRYDAVTYLKYLDTLRVSEGVRSVWMLAESSHKIFELAKRRVYQVVRPDGTRVSIAKGTPTKKRKVTPSRSKKGKETENEDSASNKDDAQKVNAEASFLLEEVLEEAPKWKVLRELLQEIAEEQRKGDAVVHEDENNECGIVLVACKDERSCLQLQECILRSPHQVMREEWEKYLLGKAELFGLHKKKKKRSQQPKGFGVLDGQFPTGSNENENENAGPVSISKLETNALLAAASGISNLTKEADAKEDPVPSCSKKGSVKGKGKGVQKKITAKRQASKRKNKCTTENDNCQGTDVEASGKTVEQSDINVSKVSAEDAPAPASTPDNAEDLIDPKMLPPVQFYALDSDQHVLDIWKPSVIIVYHPDMTFVREIEVYKAENPSKKLKVYFLFYEESSEVQKFESSIRRENEAFESLIRQKSLMMIPVDQSGRCIGPTPANEPEPLFSQNSLTRKAGGRKATGKDMQVIVDMREFMSSLPNVLHQKGIRIIPVTLEVGDYVLSPLICVERKSIADLYQSFASGRLYNQVEIMIRYYKIPVLLIEFSQDKSFSFQSASEVGDDVSPTNIISKLSLLVLHFPRLRIVWSRSLHATADIFMSLKSNQDEPDENKAMRVGVPSEDGVVEDDVRAENYNTSAIEFLRRLPGVTDSNYRAIMDGCNSLAELALLPVERLAELMGSQKGARTLKEFLDAKCPSMIS